MTGDKMLTPSVHNHSSLIKETAEFSCCEESNLSSKDKIIRENSIELNLWQAAQRGDLNRVTELIDTGIYNVMDKDEGNVTALHWAAINNHCTLAKFLIDRGSSVDIKGGDLVATPLHWAARAGHVDMVNILHKRGADPTLLDSQNFNALHLAVHAGQTMMIVFLLAIGVPVDSRDGLMRTPLMWSAYQGNSIDGMDEILRNNPAIDAVDQTGYTALHWAVITQHYEFVKALLRAGASHTVKDPAGKSPGDWAMERGTSEIYKKLLIETKGGLTKKYSNSKYTDLQVNRTVTAVPWIMIPVFFWIFGKFACYISIPLAIGLVYLINAKLIVNTVLGGAQHDFQSTPLLNAILNATLFYIPFSWARMLPATGYLYFQHISLIFFYSVAVYCAYKATTMDPGTLPKSNNNEEKSKLVIQLADSGKLNFREYCVTCMVSEGDFDENSFYGTCIFGKEMCTYLSFDYWTVGMLFWVVFNVFWVSFLVVVQLIQIGMGYTTNEFMNRTRYDYLIHPDDHHAPVYRKRTLNPFNIGPIGNLVDFWSDGAGKLKEISWYNIFEVPSDLLDSALRRNGYSKVRTMEEMV